MAIGAPPWIYDWRMPTWVEAFQQTQAAMKAANGETPSGYPRVSNEQAASILRLTMNAVTKNKLDPAITSQWYPVALALSGWRVPGDRFQIEPLPGALAHRREMLPDAATPVLWTMAAGVATVANQAGIPFAAPTVNPQADYREVLRQAWDKMQRDAKADGVQPPPRPLPAAAPKTDDDGGGGNVALALLALLALTKGKL